jgi:HK97 family phage portal protein
MQLVQMMGLTTEQIARIFGIPPFLISYTEKTTSWGSGVAEMGTNFVKYSLAGRYLVKIETEINRKLFNSDLSFAEFNTASLERGDIETRFAAYRVALGHAGERSWMQPSEIRRLENLPPIPGIDARPPEGTPNAPEPNPAAAQ